MTWSKWGAHALRSPCGRYSICTSVYEGVVTYLLWRGKAIVAVEHVDEADRAGRKRVVEGMMEGVG